MGRTREIKGRIRAVGNIQRITKTMQMIATARFQAAQRRATASRPYTLKIAELVGELSAALSGDATVSHPLLKAPEPKVGRQLVLVITSNRGLCGSYNASILRRAQQFFREQAAPGATAHGQSGSTPGSAGAQEAGQIDLEIVGKKGNAYFKFARRPIAVFHSQFADRPAYEQVAALADRYMQDFSAGKYDAVYVIYMSYQSIARQAPRALLLLPLRNPTPPPVVQQPKASAPVATVDYDFTPGAEALLQEILPATVKVQLFQAFNEAAVGEHIARMVAMKSATDAAGKMSKLLTRKYNRARQTAITTELGEIVAGAAGVA